MKQLLSQGAIIAQGATRDRRYELHSILEEGFVYSLEDLQEHLVWKNTIAPLLSELPKNAKDIWQYGVTEMLNNAIDHSSGEHATINITKTLVHVDILIVDDGEGIFKKIKRELNLDDEYHSILELAKGKLTTDPDRHTGEGIFFSSRMFDRFGIFSGDLVFSHSSETDYDLFQSMGKNVQGTGVAMSLKNNTARTTTQVFDSFSDKDYRFTKTIVPVRLAQYGDEMLISRSQAKRLLARFDKFKFVVLDFECVDTIGQAFADEVFRVFVREHPEITLTWMNENPNVSRMISRVRPSD